MFQRERRGLVVVVVVVVVVAVSSGCDNIAKFDQRNEEFMLHMSVMILVIEDNIVGKVRCFVLRLPRVIQHENMQL